MKDEGPSLRQDQWRPKAGAGTASNRISCAKGDLRQATDALYRRDFEACDRFLRYATETVAKAREALKDEVDDKASSR